MPSRTLPNLALEAFFDLGEDGWGDEVSLNFLKLSVLAQAGAIDRASDTPGSPTSGDVYIFDELHPTQPNKVAVYDVDTWKYFTPLEGWLIFNRTAGYFELFAEGVWSEFVVPAASGIAGVTIEDEDDVIIAESIAIAFAGAGVTVTDAGDDKALVTIPGGISGVIVGDEGTPVVAAAIALNFAGAGVVVTDVGGGEALVTIPGASGGTVAVADEGTPVVATAIALNFAGAGVTVTDAGGGAALVTIPGASGGLSESIIIACSDETTALTAGTGKVTFRMPYAFTLSAVRASVTGAPTGSVLTVDINEGGASILSTKLTIDAGEKTSVTAATPAVISSSSIADDAEITIDLDTVGSTVAGAGLKVYLIGTKT